MESRVKDFVFCLGDNLDQYYLGTYKIGSSTLESSAEQFFHFIQYKQGKLSGSFDDLRNVKGDVSLVHNLVSSEHINILIRDPFDRLISGLIQEICSFENKKYKGIDNLLTNNKIIRHFLTQYFFVYLGKGYKEIQPDWEHINTVVPILTYFFNQDIFQQQLYDWFLQVMGIYSQELIKSKHCGAFYEPLCNFVTTFNCEYSTTYIDSVNWRVNNPHSNSLFKPPLLSALQKFNAFDEYLQRENYFYSCLIEK